MSSYTETHSAHTVFLTEQINLSITPSQLFSEYIKFKMSGVLTTCVYYAFRHGFQSNA
jgi:hypothetical protein